MQAPVEIHYAGVVVARAEELREVEGGELFLVTKEPLPVGTLVGVSTTEAQFNARVAHVVESADGANNGMRVRRLGDGDPGANLWVPPPPAKPAPAPEPVPIVEKVTAPIEATNPPEAQAPAAETALAEPQAPASVPLAAAAPVASQAPDPDRTPIPVESAPERVEPAKAAPTDEIADDSAAASVDTAPGERKAEQMPLIDDLPPARPTQAGNARRRTKRRK